MDRAARFSSKNAPCLGRNRTSDAVLVAGSDIIVIVRRPWYIGTGEKVGHRATWTCRAAGAPEEMGPARASPT